eukprot:TRINITY_DN1547_c0_g1_i2.p1 TRINITY_DN1547_c0_g1~~TRINITY_DN1547_c0_g1_i2.p1  ORF type:complete len:141 (+),score=7.62 TRINITY_DN1547_c0_g1_i2:224-646(+)
MRAHPSEFAVHPFRKRDPKKSYVEKTNFYRHDRAALRLFTRGVLLGYRRSRHIQYSSISLLKIEGVKERKDTQFYLGKRVCYIYKCHTKTHANPTRIRAVWGKIVKAHGSSGVVQARFRRNLPAKTIGASVRVMLYPSNI